jgi:hypothetical protein
MDDMHIRVRANRSTGELEVEGPSQQVVEWWDKLWPELSESGAGAALAVQAPSQSPRTVNGNADFPSLFGEFYSEFRSDITDVDKVLIAGAFVQAKEADRTFTTKAANQLLIDQNIKVANASENVRRLTQTKRVFVVSAGKFRVSTTGSEHLNSLKVNR